ncbi:MAG: GNAT family N-acetyltransferase [Gordonia sp. (in: high G+C Gram-positive bacteria)]
MTQAAPGIRVRLCRSPELSAAELVELRSMLDAAFAGDFSDTDFDHALGGVHVLVNDAEAGTGASIVGHASVVERTLTVDDADAVSVGEDLRIGYVEGVAVADSHRRRGIGGLVMGCIEREIDASYEMGVLAASDAGMALYTSRGWTSWTGQLAARTDDGVQPTPGERGAILIWRTARTNDVDVARRLVVDQRPGSAW